MFNKILTLNEILTDFDEIRFIATQLLNIVTYHENRNFNTESSESRDEIDKKVEDILTELKSIVNTIQHYLDHK